MKRAKGLVTGGVVDLERFHPDFRFTDQRWDVRFSLSTVTRTKRDFHIYKCDSENGKASSLHPYSALQRNLSPWP